MRLAPQNNMLELLFDDESLTADEAYQNWRDERVITHELMDRIDIMHRELVSLRHEKEVLTASNKENQSLAVLHQERARKNKQAKDLVEQEMTEYQRLFGPLYNEIRKLRAPQPARSEAIARVGMWY